MNPLVQLPCVLALLSTLEPLPPLVPLMDKEYLTPKEIENIQDAQEFDKRIKIYLDAADLRLKMAEERLNGKESPPDDPMEFFSVEDMLEGYYRIIRSVMLNLDDAYQKPETDKAKLTKTLKALKSTTERAQQSLAILKKIAEDKRLEDVWNAVNHAIDINTGALEGADQGLAGSPEPDKKGPPRKKKTKPEADRSEQIHSLPVVSVSPAILARQVVPDSPETA